MSTLHEAAQKALEVLIRASSYYDTYPEIAALEAALAEPVPDSKHSTIAEWRVDKQRKPLTDDEIDQIAIKCLDSPMFSGWNRNLARAIERAHGIKDA